MPGWSGFVTFMSSVSFDMSGNISLVSGVSGNITFVSGVCYLVSELSLYVTLVSGGSVLFSYKFYLSVW